VTHDPEEAMTLGDRVMVLREGVLQQAGRPLDLYERPVNRFVAAFLGWPPASFLDGRLCDDVEGLTFEGSGGRLPVPSACRAAWRRFVGRAVTIGVRAERVSWGRTAAGEGLLTMQVERVERLGSVSVVHLSRCDWRLTALHVGPTLVDEGTVPVGLDLSRARLFDAGTGAALEAPGG